MSHSTSGEAKQKPAKPYPDFPLFPHATKRWAKKIRGKFHYFGPWSDPDGALQKYLDQRDDLHAGRTPRVRGDGLTVRDLLNRFLTGKRRLADNAEISERTFLNYKRTSTVVIGCFGTSRFVDDLAAEDFGQLRSDLSTRLGHVALGVEIQQVRILFKWAYDMRLIKAPVPFGPEFKAPNKRLIRLERNGKGLRMFEADELRTILAAVPTAIKAMVLLGVNGGVGNHDCARLPMTALDWQGGWLNYPRFKTGVSRRIPLWPETVEALRLVITERPEPASPEDSGLVFLDQKATRWVRLRDNAVWVDRIGSTFSKWLVKLGIKRPGLNFYALRHTFETVAGGSLDQVGVDHIMGHSRQDMASVYRERISDDRLRAVVEHVRKWLFGTEKTQSRVE
jgi:integrase